MKYRMMLFVLLTLASIMPARAVDVVDILRASDESRGNLDGVTWHVTILSEKKGKIDTMTLDVRARGFDVVTETISPASYKGNKLIMRNGNMWFYKPGLSKPVPISKRQRLMGNAAYGDIAATNYADDYRAELLGEETVDDEVCYKFNLSARSKQSTYDRICYWVSKKRRVGVKADYYTVSGKRFKTATMKYDHRVLLTGRMIPFISHLIIRDALLDNSITELRLDNPVLKELPDYLFNLNLLKR